MQEDFHYYATYCAAFLAGYSHEESLDICYSAQFVDCCTKTYIEKINGPKIAATTQLQSELADAHTDIIGLQDITRIWASFHFLPGDLYAELPKRSLIYMNKYRLICHPNSDLLLRTVELAKDSSLQAVGLAMHVLADTWAHSYFAGTPSFVINDATDFSEIIKTDGTSKEIPIRFNHNPVTADDIEKNKYTNCIRQDNENSIMNLGHGRAGHLPDYSFIRYRFMPAWDDYEYIYKDNPSDYYHAFCQMISAMKYLRGEKESFEKNDYDEESVALYRDEIMGILEKRQTDASRDWQEFGQKLSGQVIPDFDIERYTGEYMKASKQGKIVSFLGRFMIAAVAQKNMVTNEIFSSGNLLAGNSIDIAFPLVFFIRKMIKRVLYGKIKKDY